MNIAGLGTQILECVRVRELIDSHEDRFLTEVYTPREQLFCRQRTQTTEHYAAIWAAKEAVLRCLGTTWRKGMSWLEVEIVCENPLEPVVIVSGATRKLLDLRDVKDVIVSMAHTRHYATATAIAVR